MTTQKSSFSPTPRTQLKRNLKRAVYERDQIHQILDEAFLCTMGLSIEGSPCVLPTIHTRIDDQLYVHGSNHNRLFAHVAKGAEVCFSVTILDGLVLARSSLHHSMNYRSVVLFAKGRLVEDRGEKMGALQALVDQLIPGRWEDARQPSENELKATTVVAFPIEEASAKVRTGPPIDSPEDQELPVWAGVLPVHLAAGSAITDPTGVSVPLPDYMSRYDVLPRAAS